jgi:hypothetical protein
MINARNDLCDVCNAPKAKEFVTIPTGLRDIKTLPIRLCPECWNLCMKRSDTLMPVFDAVVRALKLLRNHYLIQPLPSPDDTQAGVARADNERVHEA